MHRPTPIDNERDRLDASRWAAVTLPSSVTPRVCDTAPEGPHIAAECVLSAASSRHAPSCPLTPEIVFCPSPAPSRTMNHRFPVPGYVTRTVPSAVAESSSVLPPRPSRSPFRQNSPEPKVPGRLTSVIRERESLVLVHLLSSTTSGLSLSKDDHVLLTSLHPALRVALQTSRPRTITPCQAPEREIQLLCRSGSHDRGAFKASRH